MSTITGIRDRALAAAHEREQEMNVEAERRATERKARVLDAGTHRVVAALTDDAALDRATVRAVAERLGIAVRGDVDLSDTGRATVTFEVDGMTLVYTEASDSRTLRLVGPCDKCGEDLTYGISITGLVSLGLALADQEAGLASFGHECPDESVWEGNLTLSAALATSCDPALVLLDALQSYIHAAVAAAMDAPIGLVPVEDDAE